MAIIFYNASATVRKAELTSAISTSLHQSLNGECALSVTAPGHMLPGVVPGDYVRMDTLYFKVRRVQRNSRRAGALYSVSCEHISYLLNEIPMPAGTYSGGVSAVLAQILAGTPLSVGDVDVTGSYEIIVKTGANRRQVLQQWATITGAEISYTYTQVNFRVHVGSDTPVLLSEAENVVSLSVQYDAQTDSVNYTAELSRLQTLGLGDELEIRYESLDVDTATRVISLDYDYFHPWKISMQCGAFVPTIYDQASEDLEEVEELVEDVKTSVADLAESVDETVTELVEETIPATVDSKMELALVRAQEMNFSGWDSGSFFEILDNGVQINYTVLFDGSGRPVLIADGDHACVIVW